MHRVVIAVFFLPLLSKLAMDSLKKKEQYLFHQYLLILKDWPQITDVKFFSLVAIHNI